MKIRKIAIAFAALLTGALCSGVVAADKSKKVKYVPPTGFGGHQWGELRANFDRLPQDPLGIGAAFTRPVLTDQDFICKPIASIDQGGGDSCDLATFVMAARKKFEGGGFYVLSEYTTEGQGFRYGSESDGVVLYPIVYQFCANWDDTKKVVPEKFDEMNKFCGVRLMFRSETREQLRRLPGDHVTAYDRILNMLIEKFGKPDGFIYRGRVLIETMEGESSDAADRKFSIWRWCSARDGTLHTSCSASVGLSLDPATGVGTVLYSTPLLWEYAYAREHGGFKGDKLFKMLHARK